MKKKLYIDFDGVILDSITVMYNIVKEKDEILYQHIMEHKQSEADNKEITHIFNNLDWEKLITETPQINDSIKNINYLIEIDIFAVAILTHVSSFAEMEAKFKFIKENIKGDIDIICVPKKFDKTMATRSCKNSILVDDHSGNLRNWQKAGGVAVKFEKTERVHPEFKCISSLDQLVELFK